MANTGFNLNRGLIRRFDYSNLPPTNIQLAPSINGIIKVDNTLPNFIQTFGANNLAKIQNMKTEETYNNSELNSVTINANVTLNTENLNGQLTLNAENANITGDIATSASVNLNISDSTNFVTLTSS